MGQRFFVLSAVLAAALGAAGWLALAGLPSSGPTEGQGAIPGGRATSDDAFAGRVRAALLADPDILVEVSRRLAARQESSRDLRPPAALAALGREVRESPVLPVGGNPAGDVTVVEFVDYRCGFCKRAVAPLAALAEGDGGVRIVYRELPVLGPPSERAARLAIAATPQGGYPALHAAFMAHRGSFELPDLLAIAASHGLDVDRLRLEMHAPWVEREIADARRQAEALGIRGTPAFLIGDRLVPGLIDLEAMQSLVAEARRRCLTC